MDYFDFVVSRLKPKQTLYKTHEGAQGPNIKIVRTSYIYMGLGKSRNEDAIRYSIKQNTKRISRSFLNGVHQEYVRTGSIPSPQWCRQNFKSEMNDGHCNYCVAKAIIDNYKMN
jgi:hypothetical protein